MTATDIDAIRKREQAATEGPWFYDSYSGVFSAPKVALWDPWLDTVDDSHSMDRHGRCEACGKDGCRLFSEAYNRDPLVAHVPAHHGDTAIDVHAADAEFIAHARTDIPALLAELDRVREQAKDSAYAAEQARTAVTQLRAQVVVLADKLHKANAEIQRLTRDGIAYANENAKLRERIAAARLLAAALDRIDQAHLKHDNPHGQYHGYGESLLARLDGTAEAGVSR